MAEPKINENEIIGEDTGTDVADTVDVSGDETSGKDLEAGHITLDDKDFGGDPDALLEQLDLVDKPEQEETQDDETSAEGSQDTIKTGREKELEDRLSAQGRELKELKSLVEGGGQPQRQREIEMTGDPVSYTHLTLPTKA